MTNQLKKFLQKASGDEKLTEEMKGLQKENNRDVVIAKIIKLAEKYWN